MARGWESKDVEAQIEEREEARRQLAAKEPSKNEQKRQQQLASLELTRTRVLQDLEAAKNPKYQEMLRRALEHLDRQIAELAS